MNRCLALASILTVTLALGCGDGRIPISGTVTVQGEPVEEGAISFIPVSGEGAVEGAAITQGSYSTLLTKGEKSVQINGRKKVGEKVYDPTMKDSPVLPVMEEVVPKKYNRDSPLKATISEEKDDLNFDLDAK